MNTYCLSCKKDTRNIDPKVTNKKINDVIKMFYLQK